MGKSPNVMKIESISLKRISQMKTMVRIGFGIELLSHEYIFFVLSASSAFQLAASEVNEIGQSHNWYMRCNCRRLHMWD